MDILVIGGTVFVGRHFAAEALARGHRVTLFHRGSKGAGIVPGVEEIFGDRDGGLEALPDRKWDAVVDTCGYVPRVVRQSAEKLAGKTDRYLFVSTVSVYTLEGQETLNEDSPVEILEDPTMEEVMKGYGGLKFLCEEVVREVYGDRAFVVRPGLIVGPYDVSSRFTYWVSRFAEGGDVLCPDRPSQPMQLIDVRDLTAFMMKGLEDGLSGAYNLCGPEASKTLGDMIEVCNGLNPDAKPVWADPNWLVEQEVQLWQELPLVLPPDGSWDAMNRVDIGRAIEAGLTFRPWDETAADTLVWRLSTPEDGPPRHGLDREKERQVLDKWKEASR